MANHSTDRTTARLAGTALALASVLAIAGFTALGSVFAYPQILHEPTSDILALYRQHQTAVMGWFGVLIVSAALMAPAGVWVGRLAGGTLGRAIAGVGVAAAAVQVVGLQRWLTLVPGFSQDALDPGRRASAEQRFQLWHSVLGTGVGETAGYTFTALFTVLVVLALGRSLLPRWLAVAGLVAAGLIVTGVLVPLVRAASLSNFAGYLLWCVWLIAVAIVLFRFRPSAKPTSAVFASRPAHAGSRHEDGRSAIREAAHQILAVESLTDYPKGVTTTVGLISGGTAANVIPQHCRFEIDLRVVTAADGEDYAARILGLKARDPDVRVTIQGGMNRPPYERSEATGALFEHARREAAGFGVDLEEVRRTGGGSDGNFTAALGVPTLDGLGIDGDGAHTLHEYGLISSIAPRMRLMRRLLETL